MNEQQERFMRACESQWLVGGERYALSEDKEWTDLVCEVVGNQWIGGNIIKYAGEIRNSKRFGERIIEVNFFKIAVYAYIWWLKEYRHPTTGVELKKEHWPSFMEKCWERERLIVGREITAARDNCGGFHPTGAMDFERGEEFSFSGSVIFHHCCSCLSMVATRGWELH